LCPSLGSMKAKELPRKLHRAGCEIDETRGKGGHYLVTFGREQTTVPIHGDSDLGPEFVRRLCKQLGLDPRKVLGG
jgi:mRNA interferase HicA